jgi:tetratricopeptide (TPR) repeat protein
LDEAVACFEGALDADPRYVEAWNNLASVQLARNEWQRAVEAGCRAVDLARNYADAHFNLAQAYHALGRRDEARRHARLYWKLDPHSEWARLLREDLDLS